jgi:hypothetical protein
MVEGLAIVVLVGIGISIYRKRNRRAPMAYQGCGCPVGQHDTECPFFDFDTPV